MVVVTLQNLCFQEVEEEFFSTGILFPDKTRTLKFGSRCLLRRPFLPVVLMEF